MSPKRVRAICTLAGCTQRVKRNASRFCSLLCHSISEFGRREELLLSGSYPPVQNTVGFLRRYLTRRHGETCTRCGWCERHPVTGRVPLEVEHIDGDWRNNRPENITLLCPNCHSLTSFHDPAFVTIGLDVRAVSVWLAATASQRDDDLSLGLMVALGPLFHPGAGTTFAIVLVPALEAPHARPVGACVFAGTGNFWLAAAILLSPRARGSLRPHLSRGALKRCIIRRPQRSPRARPPRHRAQAPGEGCPQ